MKQYTKWWNYGKYSSGNYGTNTLAFQDSQGNCFWYSYNTLVAFRKTCHSLVIHENVWGITTGKHLNWIDDDHKIRVDSTEFEKKYEEYFGQEDTKSK